MIDYDFARVGLFVAAIWLSWKADVRLRRPNGTSCRKGYPLAAWAGLAFCACAYAFR